MKNEIKRLKKILRSFKWGKYLDSLHKEKPERVYKRLIFCAKNNVIV